MTILETLQKEFTGIKHHTYYSDLYIWHENLQSVEDFLKSEHINYRKFIDNIDHVTWIEITFGYIDEYINHMTKRSYKMKKRDIEKAREMFGNTETFKEAEAYLWQHVGTMMVCVDLVKESRAEWLISEGFIDDESEYEGMVTQGFVNEHPSGIIVWML